VLRNAVVKYHIMIVNSTITLSTPDVSQNNTVRLVSLLTEDTGLGTYPSTLGGFYLDMDNLYSGSIAAYFGVPFRFKGTNTFSLDYYSGNESSVGTCAMTWSDPIPDILSAASELMFRSALSVSNSTTTQNADTQISTITVYYSSNYRYLAAALIVVFLDVVLIFPLFWGWWRLGRDVSLSPLEIAKAFGAPLPVNGDLNERSKTILKRCGGISVQYGAVNAVPSFETMSVLPGKQYQPEQHFQQHVGAPYTQRLIVAESQYVEPPRNRTIYI
jgi:hypothetical protein